MTGKNVALYGAALAAFFALGCLAALCLRAYDRYADAPSELTDGQRHTLPGLALSLPQGYRLDVLPEDDPLRGQGGSLFDALAQGENGSLLLHVYPNASGDDIADYAEQELVTSYVGAGYEGVRTRTLGERRFICYSARMESEGGALWYAYETWTPALHLAVETPLSPRDALPILATIELTADAVQ